MTPEYDAPSDVQQAWWDACYAAEPCLFGPEPSVAGLEAAARFRSAGVRDVLELGSGHGRDTLHFAREGFSVTALDYAPEAVRCLAAAADREGLADRVAARVADLRGPVPSPDGSFDAAYAHMLLCMDLADDELDRLVAEAHRVLRPGGLFVYTARTDRDPHCGIGVDRGDGRWETGGFVVRFFGPATVERLATGWEVVATREFEEGALPRRLVAVTMRRP